MAAITRPPGSVLSGGGPLLGSERTQDGLFPCGKSPVKRTNTGECGAGAMDRVRSTAVTLTSSNEQ